MKKITTTLLILLASLCCNAQVTNNAISFERNGRISLGTTQVAEEYTITDSLLLLQERK